MDHAKATLDECLRLRENDERPHQITDSTTTTIQSNEESRTSATKKEEYLNLKELPHMDEEPRKPSANLNQKSNQLP